MRRPARKFTFLSASLLALGLAGTRAIDAQAPAAAATLKPFVARYKVEAFGFLAGTAEISLENGAPGEYQYRTTLNPHGLFRFAIPSGATLTTWVRFDGSRVQPLRYREEDGSSDTDKDVALEFDWTRALVQGTAHDELVRLAVAADTQDPLSLQLAVLADLASGREPHGYAMVDKTKVKQYAYKAEGTARIPTELGTLDTVIYSSSRAGSSKVTRVWYAPSLDFTAVRSDDLDDGKVRIRMTILSLKR
ncbi:MAG TPA: DUF3108 domain-containing protein [Steroidobacteraceae bacterium]|nr:DUF3108 domain-containing protein [Steroidobacteraceae bacterium]